MRRSIPIRLLVLSCLVPLAVLVMRPRPASALDLTPWVLEMTAIIQDLADSVKAKPPTSNPKSCPIMLPINGGLVWGDAEAWYPGTGGWLDGRNTLAFKIEGEFPHSATLALTGYDDWGFIPSANHVLDDANIKPDPGQKNPFTPGTLIDVPNRKYTAWAWPAGIRVPPNLKNVFLYETQPVDPNDSRQRFAWILRMYKMNRGYDSFRAVVDSMPQVTLYDTSDLKHPMRCTFNAIAGTIALGATFGSSVQEFGNGEPPQPWKVIPGSNAMAFSRLPSQYVPVPEGFGADGAVNYLTAIADVTRISVITMHKTPTYYDNQNLPPKAVFGNYESRYMSFVLGASWPIRFSDMIDATEAIYQEDGSWVTVALPTNPRLSSDQEAQVRARAALLGYNVIGGGRPPISGVLAEGITAFRQKVPAPGFQGSLLNVPSWVADGNDFADYNGQTSPEFFARYASNPENMGPYWIDGVVETFDEFMLRH